MKLYKIINNKFKVFHNNKIKEFNRLEIYQDKVMKLIVYKDM